MMIHRETSDKLYSIINSAKRVGSVTTTKDEFWKFISTVNLWNKKGKGTNLSAKYNQAEYVIPNFLSGLILPEWVSFTGSTMERNLYPDKIDFPKESAELLSPLEFNNIGRSLCGTFKISIDDMQVMTLRHQTAKFADVVNNQVKDGFVVYSKETFRPIQLCDWYVYPDAAYNTDAETVLTDWFSDIIQKAINK